MQLSVVIPVYNEEESLVELHAQLEAVAAERLTREEDGVAGRVCLRRALPSGEHAFEEWERHGRPGHASKDRSTIDLHRHA